MTDSRDRLLVAALGSNATRTVIDRLVRGAVLVRVATFR
jgi:hypothetical protein